MFAHKPITGQIKGQRSPKSLNVSVFREAFGGMLTVLVSFLNSRFSSRSEDVTGCVVHPSAHGCHGNPRKTDVQWHPSKPAQTDKRINTQVLIHKVHRSSRLFTARLWDSRSWVWVSPRRNKQINESWSHQEHRGKHSERQVNNRLWLFSFLCLSKVGNENYLHDS